MSIRKFVSGISALAVAAGAFAAMAVTASAADYSESITLGAGNGYNIASYNSSGVATAKSGIPYAALRADLSELTDIDNASSVTVEFDAATYSGNVVVFSFGDAEQRTTIADGSGNFKTGGLAMYFGSVNGSDLKAYDKKSGQSKTLGSAFFGKILHAKVRFNKDAGTYDYELSQGSNKITQTGVATDIGNLTYVEAFTKTAGAQMMFKSITVSYTVPDPPEVTATVEASEAFTKAGGYDKDMVVGELNVIVKNGTYDLKGATYNQTQGTVTDTAGNAVDQTSITGDANGTSVIVFAVLNDVDDVAELDNIVFE